VIVMAAGQLAGGLAWLAISGEDAPELVATAPVGPDAVIRAKMEAVLGGTFIVVIPLILPIAFLDMRAGAVALFAVCAATMSSTAIQFWFRSQAKRSSFRRRHTSSRIATFAEAFSSILWSGMAALWIAGGVLLAVPFALIIGALLLLVRKLSPKGVN
ncbi:MAG: permease, partial [Nitratireductor sp.]|nr:permease [Nitratireductor sp.]